MANLVSDLGGPDGFGTKNLGRNDDGSSSAIDITSIFPHGINLFGKLYSTIYINNNGNITFTSPLSEFTPSSIGIGFTAPIIAPYWADVDTSGGAVTPTGGGTAGTNLVWYDLDVPSSTITITWDDVGYYSANTNKVNAFQLQLTALPSGVAEIKFIYEDVTWVSGSASGGSNGLGGTPARIGYSSGQGTYYEIPESGKQAALLTLPTTDGNAGQPGVFEFISGASGIYSFALPSVTTASGNPPGDIDFGSVHVGDAPTSILTVTNAAAPPAEGLDASVTSSGAATAAGSISLLRAGLSDNTSLHVGLQTASDGAKSGTVYIGLASDGQGTSGNGVATLPSQTVAVTGTIYAYAAPLFDRTVVNLAARVGARASAATVTLSDGTAADPYEEDLLYSVSLLPAAYTLSSPSSGTLASGSNATLMFSAADAIAGSFTGQTVVGLTSTGAGTSGLGDTELPSQTLTLNERVYAPATVDVEPIVNFGIVHVGEVVSESLIVTNTAAGNLTDVLTGGFAAVTSAFAGSGNFTGLEAGESGTLSIALDTSMAGVFNGTATLALQSHDPDLADIGVAASPVTLTGTVDNYAHAVLDASGASLVNNDGQYVLDLGVVTVSDSPDLVLISLLNDAAGPSDLLSGRFEISGGAGFLNEGFDDISGLGAGASGQVGYVLLDTSSAGNFVETLTLLPESSNDSGYTGALPTQTITIEGDVQLAPPLPNPVEPEPLPEPTPVTPPDSLGDGLVAPLSIDFGNVPVDGNASEPVRVSNTEPAGGNELDATIEGVTGDATGSGSITDLPAGTADSNSIVVGIDTSSPGMKTGTITIDLTSHSNEPSTVQSTVLDFQTADQSIFGTGEPTLPAFDAVLSSGSIGGEFSQDVGPYSLSLAGSVSNTLKFTAGVLNGTASVDYPIDASVELPASFEPGSSLTIDTGETGHGMLDLKTDFTGLAELALTDTLNAHFAGQAVLPGIDPVGFDQSVSLADASIGVNASTPSLELDFGDVGKLPVSASLSLPGPVETDGTLADFTGGLLPDLTSSGSSNSFVKVSGDILKLFPETAGLSVEIGDNELELAALNVALGLGLGQQFVFHPAGIYVSITPNYDLSDTQTGLLGDPFTFEVPADWDEPVVLSTTYSIEGTLDDQTGLVPQLSAELEGGTLKIEGKLLGVPLKYSIGPLFSAGTSVDLYSLTSLFEQNFELEGFNTVTQDYTIPLASGTETGDGGTTELPSQTVTVTGNVLPRESKGSLFPDPHLTTFDGLYYSFQTAGEFILTRDTNGGMFQVQARLSAPVGTSSYSVITELGIQIGADRVTIDASRASPVWVNGAAVTLTSGAIDLARGKIIKTESGYEVVLDTGETVSASVPMGGQTFGAATTYSYGISTTISLGGSAAPGAVQGLLGNDNGDPTKDLTLADGTVLPSNMPLLLLYGAYADAWRVSQATSLLDYGPGETTDTYTDRNYPGTRLTLDSFPQAAIDAAEARAMQAGITDPGLLQAAAYDYLVTSDPSFFTVESNIQQQGISTTAQADFAAPAAGPLVGVLAAQTSEVEAYTGATTADFQIYRSGDAAAALTLTYNVVASTDGDLDASDFGGTLPSGTVTLEAGQTSTDLSITLPNGIGAAVAKTLELQLSAPSSVTVIGSTAELAIFNAAPTAGIAPVFGVEFANDLEVQPTQDGTNWTLDLGTLQEGETFSPGMLLLAVMNEAAAGSDDLTASITVSGDGGLSTDASPSFANLGSGRILDIADLGVLTRSPGVHTETFTFTPYNTNGTGYMAALPTETVTVTDTVVGTPTITAPTTAITGLGQTGAISGISLAEVASVDGEIFTVVLHDANGVLATPGGTSSNSGTTLTVSGSLAQVNSALASLTDTDGTAGSDTITLDASDSTGGAASRQILAVTVNGLPVIAAPLTASVTQGQSEAITGVGVSETGNTDGEMFTVTLSDTKGALAATGAAGNGTQSIAITDTLANVNADLATLTDDDPAAASDTITITLADSLGNTATQKQIAVTSTTSAGGTFTATTGTYNLQGGAGNDTFVASRNTLNPGDVIYGGGGTNTLLLQGAGIFNLATPITLANIQIVTADEGQAASPGFVATNQIVTLRAGTSLTVDVGPNPSHQAGNPKPDTITINGADNSDVINLGSGSDVVTAGGVGETIQGGGGPDQINVGAATIGATIDGGTGASVLNVTGGGTAVMGSNITDIRMVDLFSADTPWSFMTNTGSGLTVSDLNTGAADIITLAGSNQTVAGLSSALDGDTLNGFVLGDTLDFSDLNPSNPTVTWAQASAMFGTLTVNDGTNSATLSLFGQFTQAGFQQTPDTGAGTSITYRIPA